MDQCNEERLWFLTVGLVDPARMELPTNFFVLNNCMQWVYDIKGMWQHRNVWKTTWEQNATRSVYQNNNNNKQYLAKTHKYWKSSLVYIKY